MLETVTTSEGTSSQRWVFRSKVDGAQRHSVVLNVREQVSYKVGPGPALKSDDDASHIDEAIYVARRRVVVAASAVHHQSTAN